MKIEHKTDYRDRRALEYPPLGELADALFHERQGDPSKLRAYWAKVDAVKARYPKDTSR